MADFNDGYYSKEENRREKRRGRVVDIIAVVFCLIAAIGIWLFAVNSKEPQKSENETPKTETVASRTVLSEDFAYFN